MIPTVRHTIYGTYGYNWNVKNLPMTVNVGGGATFGADVNTYGTLFATYGIGF